MLGGLFVCFYSCGVYSSDGGFIVCCFESNCACYPSWGFVPFMKLNPVFTGEL
jgi:hypothetical protein